MARGGYLTGVSSPKEIRSNKKREAPGHAPLLPADQRDVPDPALGLGRPRGAGAAPLRRVDDRSPMVYLEVHIREMGKRAA